MGACSELLVSVIIPTFNRSALFLDALDWIAADSCTNLEIIVVDDGSTDDTQARLAKWCEQHDGLRVTPLKMPNRGATHGAITVEDEVWIGAGATTLPGVTIGRNAVIAVGAVVTADVPPMTVTGGVPARMIRHIRDGD